MGHRNSLITNTMLRRLLGLPGMFYREISMPVDLSPYQSLRSWVHGYRRFSFRVCGLHQVKDLSGYINDLESKSVKAIYGDIRPVIQCKLASFHLMAQLGIPTPVVHGFIRHGITHPILESAPPVRPDDFFRRVVRPRGRLVLKPDHGWHGDGVFIVSTNGDQIELSGEPKTEHELADFVRHLDEYLVTDYLEQGAYGRSLYPDSANTVRIVTLQDPETFEIFISHVVQRIGTDRSRPVDNFKMGAGGLSALVDIETGVLGPAAKVSKTGDVSWHETHPDTGSPIKGAIIPNWGGLKAKILEYSNRLSFAPMIGWDVVAMESGFSVLEINAGCGPHVIQVHGPILNSERTRKFFRHYGIMGD